MIVSIETRHASDNMQIAFLGHYFSCVCDRDEENEILKIKLYQGENKIHEQELKFSDWIHINVDAKEENMSLAFLSDKLMEFEIPTESAKVYADLVINQIEEKKNSIHISDLYDER